MMANRMLRNIAELSPAMLAVNPLATGKEREENMAAMRESLCHLRSGGALGMFPGQRVSGYEEQIGAVCDRKWSDHALRLAKKVGATVVVLHIDGHNSDAFIHVPYEQTLKRILGLSKEVPKQLNKTVNVSLGKCYTAKEVTVLATKADGAEKMRASCYVGADKSPAQESAVAAEQEIVKVGSKPEVVEAVAALSEEHFLCDQGEFELYLFQGSESEVLLNEIGRCREITFQQIAAGSGNEVDLTPEDPYYHHLMLWDKQNACLVGAYRIGLIQEVIKERGEAGVYLDHVFKFDPQFYKELGNAMELSRSFILPEYQKNPKVLDMLWKGLGMTAKLKDCYTMFGSVTISAAFTSLSQSTLVETLNTVHGDKAELRSLVQAKIPFKASTSYHKTLAGAWAKDGINKLNGVIEELENHQRPIPPLVRYYIALGAKFLAFNVEPTFNNAIYCLLRVDLREMPPRYRKRFLGE